VIYFNLEIPGRLQREIFASITDSRVAICCSNASSSNDSSSDAGSLAVIGAENGHSIEVSSTYAAESSNCFTLSNKVSNIVSAVASAMSLSLLGRVP
jgi:hypothetical protein